MMKICIKFSLPKTWSPKFFKAKWEQMTYYVNIMVAGTWKELGCSRDTHKIMNKTFLSNFGNFLFVLFFHSLFPGGLIYPGSLPGFTTQCDSTDLFPSDMQMWQKIVAQRSSLDWFLLFHARWRFFFYAHLIFTGMSANVPVSTLCFCWDQW